MLFYTLTLLATTATTWGAPVHRRDQLLGNAFTFDPTQPNDCSPTGLASDIIGIRVPLTSLPEVSSVLCQIATDDSHGVSLFANGAFVNRAVSVLGVCESCKVGDIEVTPALMVEMTGAPDALTQPLPGAFVVETNGLDFSNQ